MNTNRRHAVRILLNVLFATAIGAWAVLTAAQQSPRGQKWVGRIGFTGAFVPIWTFFAPQPGDVDLELLVRDRLDNGSETAWEQVASYTPRRIRNMFVDPGRRSAKTIFDSVSQLRSLASDDVPVTTIQLTTPYLILLNHISRNLQHNAAAVQTQFLIIASAGHEGSVEDPLPVFASRFHSLPELARSR